MYNLFLMRDLLSPAVVDVMAESAEGRRELNRHIAQRLDAFFVGGQHRIYLRSVLDSNVRISLDKSVVSEGKEVFNFYIPERFVGEVYSMAIDSIHMPIGMRTPYSESLLPSVVVTNEERRAFNFANVFCFDKDGNGALGCLATEMTDYDENDEKLPFEGGEAKPIQSQYVDFMPQEEDTEMELAAQDYRRILLHLALIQQGQFVPK